MVKRFDAPPEMKQFGPQEKPVEPVIVPQPTKHYKPQAVEDDTPVPRRKLLPDRTMITPSAETDDEPQTRPHAASPPTEVLTRAAWEDPPSPSAVREPTEAIPAPEALTSKMPSAENLAPAPEKFDRVGWAGDRLDTIASTFDVDRMPTTAQFLRGMSAGVHDTPVEGFVQHVAKRLAQRVMMADHGLGGGLTEPQMTRLLIEIAGEVTAGVSATRQAQLSIAQDLADKAGRYRTLAESSKRKDDVQGELLWTTRADALSSEARRLKDGR